MRRDVTLVIAVGVLLASAGVAWWTRLCATDLAGQREDLKTELAAARERENTAAGTRARIEGLDEALCKIEDRLDWEPDPTNILRWFADTAERSGVRLIHSQVMSLRKGEDLIGDKKLRRTQYAVRVQGTYAGLVGYLDRVERSPHVMIVEEFSLAARRNADDDGELRLTVSALCPIGMTGPAPGEDEAGPAGGSDE